MPSSNHIQRPRAIKINKKGIKDAALTLAVFLRVSLAPNNERYSQQIDFINR